MKQYTINHDTEAFKACAVFTLKSCDVEVYKDNYKEGEGDLVYDWDLKEYDGMQFNNLQAVINFIANKCIYDKDYTKPKNWMAFEYDDKEGILRLDTDVLVNGENYPACESDIESWKNGEVELYTAHYFVYVQCEYTAVLTKDAIKMETKGLGFDTDL